MIQLHRVSTLKKILWASFFTDRYVQVSCSYPFDEDVHPSRSVLFSVKWNTAFRDLFHPTVRDGHTKTRLLGDHKIFLVVIVDGLPFYPLRWLPTGSRFIYSVTSTSASSTTSDHVKRLTSLITSMVAMVQVTYSMPTTVCILFTLGKCINKPSGYALGFINTLPIHTW